MHRPGRDVRLLAITTSASHLRQRLLLRLRLTARYLFTELARSWQHDLCLPETQKIEAPR
jgi:hypothetical protein